MEPTLDQIDDSTPPYLIARAIAEAKELTSEQVKNILYQLCLIADETSDRITELGS